MSFNPLISLARNAKRQRMEMQCDPQWVLDLAAERDQLREERDSHQRLCIAEMEKNAKLRAELEAIRGQQLVGYQYQDRNGEWRGFCDEEHYQNTVEDGTWPIRAIYALPPQQPDAVSVPRELVQEALEMAIDDAEEHQRSPCFNPTRQRVLDAQVEQWRDLLSTKNAEEVE